MRYRANAIALVALAVFFAAGGVACKGGKDGTGESKAVTQAPKIAAADTKPPKHNTLTFPSLQMSPCMFTVATFASFSSSGDSPLDAWQRMGHFRSCATFIPSLTRFGLAFPK